MDGCECAIHVVVSGKYIIGKDKVSEDNIEILRNTFSLYALRVRQIRRVDKILTQKTNIHSESRSGRQICSFRGQRLFRTLF
jgi:hypothetical protein